MDSGNINSFTYICNNIHETADKNKYLQLRFTMLM